MNCRKPFSAFAILAVLAGGFMVGGALPGGVAHGQDDNQGCTFDPQAFVPVLAGGSVTIPVSGTYDGTGGLWQDFETPSYTGDISIHDENGPLVAVVAGNATADGNGNVEGQHIAIDGNAPGTGTVTLEYQVNANDEQSTQVCDVTVPVTVTVAAPSTTTVWDNPDPASPLATQEQYPADITGDLQGQAYILQNVSENRGMVRPEPGESTSGQVPVPRNYVTCGIHTTADGRTLDPIACPIDPGALAAGFSYDPSVRWHADSNQNGGGPIYCTSKSQNGDALPQGVTDNTGIMNGVWSWGNRNNHGHAVDQPDCAAIDPASGVALQSPSSAYTLITAPSAGNTYCPTDSVVVGAPWNEGNNNESIATFGCAAVLFPPGKVPPPPPPPPPGGPATSTTSFGVTLVPLPSTIILGATTTLAWEAVETTSTATSTLPNPPPNPTPSSTPTSTTPAGGCGANCGGRRAPPPPPIRSFDFSGAPHAFALMSVARADGQGIDCGFTAGSDASGPLPSGGLPSVGSRTVTPTSPGIETYTIGCSNRIGGAITLSLSAQTSTVVTVIPPGTVTVASQNSATHGAVASTWTFTAPAMSPLNNCGAGSDPACAGSSATYPGQPSGGPYTISPVGAPVGYAFNSAASNGGYNANNPMSQTLQPGATDSFDLVWDPIASMNVAPATLTLTSSTTSGQVAITNSGTDGSTLGGITASVPSDAQSWLSVSGISGASLTAGGSNDSVDATVSVNTSAAPACASGCSEVITFNGTSAPGSATPTGAVTVTYYGSTPPPPCTGTACDATALIGASSTEMTLGSPTTLTWSSTNASGCSASSDSQGSGDLSSISGANGSQAVTPATAGNKDYTITCPSVYADEGGHPGIDTVAVTVTNSTTTCEMAHDCVSPPVQVHLSLASTTITEGSSTLLSWNSLYAASTCTATGPSWSGNEPNHGSSTVTQEGTYALTCPAADGTDNSGSGSASLTVMPNATSTTPTPTSTVQVSMSPSNQSIQIGSSASFSWNAVSTPNEPLTCTASSSPAESDGWNGRSEPSASSTTVTPASLGTHLYTLNCTNSDGVLGSGNLTVDVRTIAYCETTGSCGGSEPSVTLTPAYVQTIQPGQPATITWQSYNANSCTASEGTQGWPGIKGVDGSQTFTSLPLGTYHYDMYCSNTAGATSTTAVATVVVEQKAQAPVAVTLLSNGMPESTIDLGQPLTLTWTTSNAQSCAASTNPSAGGGSWSGSEPTENTAGTVVKPAQAGTYTYALSCINGSGSAATGTAVVTIHSVPPSCSFGADPASIGIGATSTLSWSCSADTQSCTVSGATYPGTGGSTVVKPARTTTYTLTCTGQDDLFSQWTATVDVQSEPGFREINP